MGDKYWLSLVALIIGLVVLLQWTPAVAYDPFKKPAPKPHPTVKQSVQPPQVQQPPPITQPEYKEEMVLPKMKASNYRVLGIVNNKYIVLDLNSGNIILWEKYVVKNGCLVINREVECYEEKKVRVR